MYVCMYVYICIYIYIYREREMYITQQLTRLETCHPCGSSAPTTCLALTI